MILIKGTAMKIVANIKNPLSTLTFERKTISYSNVLDTVLELFLYVNCFFPFLKFIYFGSDTQPYAMLFGFLITVIYIWRERTMPKEAVLLLLCGIFMGAFALTGLNQISTYMVFRSYSAYVTLMFVPIGTFLIMKKRGGLNELFAKCCIWFWFLVGFIQKWVDSEFGYVLTVRHTTGLTRGVVSMAPEPSTYGYMCMFMLLIAMGFQKKRLLYAALLLTQICVFANSSITLVYLAVYAGTFVFGEIVQAKKFTLLKIVLLVGCVVAGIYIVRNYVPQSNRIRILVDYAFDDPSKFINDGSIQIRINEIAETFGGFWSNNGIPHGLSAYKYMSGIGLVLLEAGWFGVFILVVVAVIVWGAYPRKNRLMYTLGLMLMMVSAIPFSAPLFCFYLGMCLYNGWVMKNKKLEAQRIEGSLDM